MSDDCNTKTQALIINLTSEMRSYNAKNDVMIEQLRDMQREHSQEIWGTGDSNPGIKSKMTTLNGAFLKMEGERLIEKREQERERDRVDKRNFWIQTAIATPVIGLAIDWILKKLHS